MLSPFLVSPLKTPMVTNPPTHASWSWHSPTLEHKTFTGPRASPPTDD
ncbi:mCG146966 [Mus musculus]|nr:mCG146966 [Mus musculus]